MSLFQSALDFLTGPGSLGAASRDQNDFVGQTVEMGDMKLRIKRVIAEGKSGRRRQAAPGAGLGRAGRGGPAAAGLGWASPRVPGLPLPLTPFRGRVGLPLGRPRPTGSPPGGPGVSLLPLSLGVMGALS